MSEYMGELIAGGFIISFIIAHLLIKYDVKLNDWF